MSEAPLRRASMPSRSASARTPGTTCQHIQAMSTMTQGWRCQVKDRHRRMRKAPQDIERNLPWLTNDPWTASPMAIRPNRSPNASIGRRLHSKVDDRASRRPQQHHEQKPGAHTGHTAVRMRRHRVSDLQPPDPNDKCSCGFSPCANEHTRRVWASRAHTGDYPRCRPNASHRGVRLSKPALLADCLA